MQYWKKYKDLNSSSKLKCNSHIILFIYEGPPSTSWKFWPNKNLNSQSAKVACLNLFGVLLLVRDLKKYLFVFSHLLFFFFINIIFSIFNRKPLLLIRESFLKCLCYLTIFYWCDQSFLFHWAKPKIHKFFARKSFYWDDLKRRCIFKEFRGHSFWVETCDEQVVKNTSIAY